MALRKTSNKDSTVSDHISRTTWNMRHSHRLGPLVIFLLSLMFVFASLPLELGSISRPGPGLWPLLIASLTAALSIATGFHSRKNEENFDLSSMLRVGYLLVALLAFPYLFDFIGFAIPSVLLVIFMMRFLSKETWARAITVAVISTGVAYVVFGVLLDIRLPAISFG